MSSTTLLEAAGLACCACALGLSTWFAVTESENALHRGWTRYAAVLERRLERLFLFRRGHDIALAQVALFVFAAGAAVVGSWPPVWFALAAAVIAIGPRAWLGRALRRRSRRIDQQVEAFLVSMSNALKSRPAVGDALASAVELMPAPLRQELELAVKQVQVGCGVDDALLEMGARVGARNLDTAVSALLIGRQVGGHLPTVLETTAGAMREMDRLEGVLRTKTANERAQLWILALLPAALLLGFGSISPGYFDPMTSSVAGGLATGVALALWAGSIVVARRILAVDI